jgi:hypothetical protein
MRGETRRKGKGGDKGKNRKGRDKEGTSGERGEEVASLTFKMICARKEKGNFL